MCAAWGDEGEKFNHSLDKFGIDIDTLKMSAAQKRYFRFWIEDWEKPLRENNYPVARAKISEKYWGLVFCEIENENKVIN